MKSPRLLKHTNAGNYVRCVGDKNFWSRARDSTPRFVRPSVGRSVYLSVGSSHFYLWELALFLLFLTLPTTCGCLGKFAVALEGNLLSVARRISVVCCRENLRCLTQERSSPVFLLIPFSIDTMMTTLDMMINPEGITKLRGDQFDAD